MARRVLGNDPFKSGAAQRSPEPGAPRPQEPPAPPAPPSRAKEPANAKAPAAPPAPPRRPARPPPQPAPKVVPHEASPTGVALRGKEPFAHPGSPQPGADPIPHAHSPGAGPDPIPHAGSPAGKRIPIAHEGSPSTPADPTPHAGSPAAKRIPVAHEGSPSTPADPTPHAGSPAAKPLPVPHAGSPSTPADPTPHAGSPAAKPLPVPHPGSPSAPADPVPHAGSPSAPADPMPHAASPEGREVTAAAPPAPSAGPPPIASAPRGVDEVAGAHARPSAPRGASAQTLALAKTLFESGVALPVLGAARGLYQALRSGLGLGAIGELDAWGKDAALSAQLEPLARFLFERYWRVTVEGALHLPAGPSLIVANHAGALPLDGPMLHYAVERSRPDLGPARWLVEDQLFHAPFFGLLAARVGAVRANPENALRLLGEGNPVIVFPEGILGLTRPYAERYQLRRFGRGGFVKIALRARVPIVPTALVGADEAMPLLAKLPGALGLPHLPVTTPPLPARWFIRFGKPIDLSGAPLGAEDDLALVQRENDRTRDTISGMLTAMLAQRDGVF